MELYAEVRRSVYVEGLSSGRRRAASGWRARRCANAALPRAARVSPDAADPVSEAGCLHGGHRSNPPRRSAPSEEAAAHGQAHLGALTPEYAFHGRLHDCQGLRAREAAGHEMFVPLAHPPGDAQADFGEALVVIAGVECKSRTTWSWICRTATTRS